jgi:hypothetical protein
MYRTKERRAMKRVTPIVALPFLALALVPTGCGGLDPSGGPDPRPTGSSTTEPVDGAEETDEPDEEPEAEPAPPAVDSCGLTDADYAAIRSALETVDPAVIGGYLANTVYVTYAATEYEGEVTGNPGLVLQNLEDVMYPGVTWQFNIPAPQLSAWAASPYYGEDFTDCAIVGTQSDDRGVSLTVADGLIVRELITFSVDAWGY